MAANAGSAYAVGVDKPQRVVEETEELVRRALGDLRRGIAAGPPPYYNFDDDGFLLRFIRSTKFDTGKAIPLYAAYCTS